MTNENDLRKLGVNDSIAKHLWQFLQNKSSSYVGSLGAIFVAFSSLVVLSVEMENWLLCSYPCTPPIVALGVIAGRLGGKLGGRLGGKLELWISKSTKNGETLGSIVGGVVFAFLAIAVCSIFFFWLAAISMIH